mgnify:CR=1 FL=1
MDIEDIVRVLIFNRILLERMKLIIVNSIIINLIKQFLEEVNRIKLMEIII